jgi:peroxiredoxin (alkyl hydroperoxide reductase subunit C)
MLDAQRVALSEKRVALSEKVRFPDPTDRGRPMTTVDTSANAVTPMPRIGDPAPEFTASTTQGPINFPGDFKGKWVIFFSHPADFTPVCTSEFITFASMQDEFRK